MRTRVLVVLLLAVTCLTCQSSDSGLSGGCSAGKVCGFYDHKYFATYYCGSMGIGYSFRDPAACVQQCNAASSWGCDASGCNCSVDHGTGAWLPCTAANNAEERSGSCFLSGSGMNGETVPCVCN
ncbi:MAG: hypothetical protein LAO51_06205 [Acidobacteriia bacterium]|nr:hypothetical protein [Terriglobia bacterium]